MVGRGVSYPQGWGHGQNMSGTDVQDDGAEAPGEDAVIRGPHRRLFRNDGGRRDEPESQPLSFLEFLGSRFGSQFNGVEAK